MAGKNNIPVSPLRYPGSKRWLSNYIARSINQNGLTPDLFIEPFAGGASVSLAMLSMGLVKKVALNDRDPLIAAFWRTVFFDTDWLIDRVLKVEVSLNKWERLKKSNPKTIRDKAFKCLFLNRTSFSGSMGITSNGTEANPPTSPIPTATKMINFLGLPGSQL